MLIVFQRKYVKPESQAIAKHQWHKLMINPYTKSLSGSLDELSECAERLFGYNAKHLIDSLLYAKLLPHSKRSVNIDYLENGTYDQTVAHLEKELELSGLEDEGELTKPTRTAVPPNDIQQNTEQTKIVCQYCKQASQVIRSCRERKKRNRNKEKILRSKTRTLLHPDHLNPVLIAIEQIILQ